MGRPDHGQGTGIGLMTDPDAADLSAHHRIERVIAKLCKRWPRPEALTRVVAFCENDPDSPIYYARENQRGAQAGGEK